MRNINAEVRNRAEGVAEHEAWRAAHAEGLKVRGAVEALNDVYMSDFAQGKTPLQTVEAFVKKVGVRLATVTLASLVNYHRADGRIGGTAKEWAEGVKNAWDAESAGKLGIHTTIHKACFDQIIRAFIKWLEEDKERRAEARRAKRRAAVEARTAKAEAERAEKAEAVKVEIEQGDEAAKAEARGEDAETDEEILEIRGKWRAAEFCRAKAYTHEIRNVLARILGKDAERMRLHFSEDINAYHEIYLQGRKFNQGDIGQFYPGRTLQEFERHYTPDAWEAKKFSFYKVPFGVVYFNLFIFNFRDNDLEMFDGEGRLVKADMNHLRKFVERDNEDYQGFKVRSIAFQAEMRAAEALQVMQEKEDAGEALRVAREALQEVFDKLHAISDIGD